LHCLGRLKDFIRPSPHSPREEDTQHIPSLFLDDRISGLYRRDDDVACVRIASRFPRCGECLNHRTTTIRLLVVVGTSNQITSTNCRHAAGQCPRLPPLRACAPLPHGSTCHHRSFGFATLRRICSSLSVALCILAKPTPHLKCKSVSDNVRSASCRSWLLLSLTLP
jgi:hypothetical protein